MHWEKKKGCFEKPMNVLTYSISHTKGHIRNGIHAPIDRHVPQVDQVAHDGHHWRVHHACRQSGNTIYRKLADTNDGLNVLRDWGIVLNSQSCQGSSPFITATCKSWGKLPTAHLSLRINWRCWRLGLEPRLPRACSLPCLTSSSNVSPAILQIQRDAGDWLCGPPSLLPVGVFLIHYFWSTHPLPSKSGHTPPCLTQPHPHLGLTLRLWEVKLESIRETLEEPEQEEVWEAILPSSGK